ncbi:diguanylate cyclase domain-containing protein [Paraburkholderia sp. BR14261]
MGEPIAFEGPRSALGVSVGVAILPDDGTEMTALIEYADRSMYETKRERKQIR